MKVFTNANEITNKTPILLNWNIFLLYCIFLSDFLRILGLLVKCFYTEKTLSIVNCPLSIIYRSNRAINRNLSNSRTSTINCQLQSTKLCTTILPNSTPPIATAKNRKLHYKSSHTQKIQKTPSPSHKFRFIVLTHEMDNGQWIMDNEGIY